MPLTPRQSARSLQARALAFALLFAALPAMAPRAEAAAGASPLAVAAGSYHTCMLMDDGTADCFGRNWFGEADDYTAGGAVAITAGSLHTCVLTSGGNVDCYGYTGDGAAADYTGGDATAVDAGAYHTCVLKSNANVDCYGLDGNGQAADYLGGDAIAVSAGLLHTCVLRGNGNVHCYGYNGAGAAAGSTAGDAMAVSAGHNHSCAVTYSGNVDCWGAAYVPDYNGGDAVAVASGDGFSCIRKSSGDVACYGYGPDGQAAPYEGPDYIIQVATGAEHACLLSDVGAVECQGKNDHGQSTDYFAPGAPSAPTFLSAYYGSSSGTIDLMWNRAGANGYAIQGYLVYRGSEPGTERWVATVWGNVNQYDDTGLPAGATYYYRVAAFNQVSRGPLSNEDHWETPTLPSEPQGLTATTGVLKTVLTWDAPSHIGANGIDWYHVHRSVLLLEPEERLLAVVHGSSPYYEDTECLLATQCTYTVTAVNVAGEGPPSNRASALGTGLPL